MLPAFLKTRLNNWSERLRGSQWFVPVLFSAAAIAAAELALQLDLWADTKQELPWPIYGGNAAAARQLLGTLAGAMVSLTTVTFSVTMIVLTLATNQFGPRLLRNFLRDRFNQSVFGAFVAAFLYCVLVFGQLPGGDQSTNVPRLAVTLALVFTVGSLFILLAFVHHTARSIQTSYVVQSAAAQLMLGLEKLFPETGAPQPDESDVSVPDEFESGGLEVTAADSGYLQAVDLPNIVIWARERKTLARVFVRPGDFITSGDRIAVIKDEPDGDTEGDEWIAAGRGWFLLGHERTGEQDGRYGFRQLVEIAVRALSPGINDPFSALNAIDHIGCALALVAERNIRSRHSRDEDGEVRLIAPVETFADIARNTFDPLRLYGREHPLVLEKLLRLLDTLAPRLKRPADRSWLKQAHGDLKHTINALEHPADRERLAALSDGVKSDRV